MSAAQAEQARLFHNSSFAEAAEGVVPSAGMAGMTAADLAFMSAAAGSRSRSGLHTIDSGLPLTTQEVST